MKYKIKNLLWRLYARFCRLFVPVLVVCCVLGFSFVPAFAASSVGTPNNILSYKTAVSTQGEAAIVEGIIPLSSAETIQKVTTSKLVTYNQTFEKPWFHFDSSMDNPKVGSYLTAEIFPLGYSAQGTDTILDTTISLDGIPNGTQFSLDAVIGGIGGGSQYHYAYPETGYEVRITYYDKNGKNITGAQVGVTEYHYDEEKGPMAYTSFTIDAPSGAVAFRIQYKFQVRILTYYPDFVLEDGVHELSFRYIINKLEYDSALEDYNTNRPLDPERPDGSETMDDLHDKEQELIEDAVANLDEFNTITHTATRDIFILADVFHALGLFMEDFLGISTMRILLFVSLALGLSGFILGMVQLVNKKEE